MRRNPCWRRQRYTGRKYRKNLNNPGFYLAKPGENQEKFQQKLNISAT